MKTTTTVTDQQLDQEFGNRGPDLAAMDQNSLTRNNAALNDQQLEEFLSSATVQGESDFIGFRVIFGHDGNGDDFLAIRNGLRDLLHFVTVLPEATK